MNMIGRGSPPSHHEVEASKNMIGRGEPPFHHVEASKNIFPSC
jgi:hypothetical protein